MFRDSFCVASAFCPPDTRYVWFRSRDDVQPYLNETAVRIRAGIMLAIPIYMAFTLVDVVFGGRWNVTGDVITDTFETDFDGRILYMVEAVRLGRIAEPYGACGLQEAMRAEYIGIDERIRPMDRAIDMAFRGQMQDRVGPELGDDGAAVLDTEHQSPEESARQILDYLEQRELIPQSRS